VPLRHLCEPLGQSEGLLEINIEHLIEHGAFADSFLNMETHYTRQLQLPISYQLILQSIITAQVTSTGGKWEQIPCSAQYDLKYKLH